MGFIYGQELGRHRTRPARSASAHLQISPDSDSQQRSPAGVIFGPDGAYWFYRIERQQDRADHDGRSHHRVCDSYGREWTQSDYRRTRRGALVHRILQEQDRADHDRRSRHQRIHRSHFQQRSQRHHDGLRRRSLVHRGQRQQDRADDDGGRFRRIHRSDPEQPATATHDGTRWRDLFHRKERQQDRAVFALLHAERDDALRQQRPLPRDDSVEDLGRQHRRGTGGLFDRRHRLLLVLQLGQRGARDQGAGRLRPHPQPLLGLRRRPDRRQRRHDRGRHTDRGNQAVHERARDRLCPDPGHLRLRDLRPRRDDSAGERQCSG